MPRIVPIQLLKCLKVLLDDNGGILSAGEVKRLASLMTKYSKKLVSKCIYVQILKCTKTELLGEFMGAGGWSLVYTWLNDAIRAMNCPLVQEILELLLLCPVDVNRLKINSAPKLVKGLCKDGGNEGVRILAKRLVEQWLKVVTENPEATIASSATASTTNMTPQATAIKAPPVAVVAPMVTSANMPQQASQVNTASVQQQQNLKALKQEPLPQHEEPTTKTIDVDDEEDDEEEEEEEPEDAEEDCHEEEEEDEQDPLGGVQEPSSNAYSLTPAQKKATESGLVYKIVVKNGNQVLAKVSKTNAAATAAAARPETDQTSDKEEEDDVETNDDVIEDNDAEDEEAADTADATTVADKKSTAPTEADENSSSSDKAEKENDSNSGNEDDSKVKTKLEGNKKSDDKKSLIEDKEKSTISSSSSNSSSKDGKSSKDKERRSSSSSIDKERDRDGKSSKSSSSSSGHRSSSSSHKSSSSKSSSSTSKSKSSSSSSSSSRRSSSDKHKSDKDRSSSSKDKDRSSSSSSSKHRSSSSSKSSSSSSSKDKYRDKDRSSSSSSSKNRDKDRESSTQSDRDKNNTSSSSLSSSSGDKLAKISKKSKEETIDESTNKPTSITIPSKKASMSIEIRKDAEKSKTVKTYKSQFRSHGLNEEAPPPPSRKDLKKPNSSVAPLAGSVLPTSLPSSLKRSSPPPRDSPTEKKPKFDMNSVPNANEKPGAIKLIPPKKIQTLVETNLFSDALSAATGPKKVTKRKRATTPAPTGTGGATNTASGKEGPSPPNSPEVPKVAPLKFYQDTLDESKTEDSKSDKENEDQDPSESSRANSNKTTDKDPQTDNENDDDDDDIPLKKVKEDIEQKVAQEKKMDMESSGVIDITKDDDGKDEPPNKANKEDSPNDDASSDTTSDVVEVKKPGPGCGPNGPPGVLMLHRRKGPKKKLTWRPQETLEQIRFFELDENERCNVTKTSFMDMKNLERFNERDAIVLARRGFNQEDNMEPTTHWRPLIEVDEVPPHPEGNQSKQRKIQAEREMTTLRALYFTQALIPDSPAEAEIEPVFNHDVPLIPLDDLTGNPDAVNDFTSMPWPESRGSPKDGDTSSMAGTGGLGSPVDMFGGPKPTPMIATMPINGGSMGGGGGYGAGAPFNPIINPFSPNQAQVPNIPAMNAMQNSPQGGGVPWQRNGGGMGGNGPMMSNPFNNSHGSPIMDMGGPPRSMGGGGGGHGHMMNNGPQQNFNNQFGPGNNNNNPFGGQGPMNPFVGPQGNNFGVMGPGGPMVPPHMMNGMGPGHMMGNNGPNMMNGPNNRNSGGGGGSWRTNGGSNFPDNNGGGNGGGGGNWRPAGPGPNNRGGSGGNGNNNNGICKAFMRGHCRVGKSCKFIHPSKGKRI